MSACVYLIELGELGEIVRYVVGELAAVL